MINTGKYLIVFSEKIESANFLFIESLITMIEPVLSFNLWRKCTISFSRYRVPVEKATIQETRTKPTYHFQHTLSTKFKAKYSKFYALRLSICRTSPLRNLAQPRVLRHVESTFTRKTGRTCMYADRFLVESQWFQLSFGRERETSCYRARYFALENLFRESLTWYGAPLVVVHLVYW